MTNAAFPLAVLITAITALGCGQSRSSGLGQSSKSPSAEQGGPVTLNHDPADGRIIALVDWLKAQGVTLEYKRHAEGDSGAWIVASPRNTDDYEIVFYIGSLPAGATEAQMREALDVNLAYQLNAPAHLAMSYAGFQGNSPTADLPRSDAVTPQLNGKPVTKVVEELFMKYK